MNQRKAYVFALLAILFWSTVASAFKLTLDYTNVPSLLWLSSLVSLLIFVVVAIMNHSINTIFQFSFKQILLSMFLGLLNPFIYYLVLFTAYNMLPAQEAMTLNYTWPLVLALLSAPVLHQKLTIKSLLALMISFAGIVVISTHGQPFAMEFENKTGTALALGSSVIWALFWLFNVKSHLPENLKLLLNFFWGSLYLSAYLLLSGAFVLPHQIGLAGAVYIGIFEMGITFVLWLKALHLTERTDKISQLVFLSPFLSLLFIHIFVGETIHAYTIAGLVLIVSGIVLQQYHSKNLKNKNN